MYLSERHMRSGKILKVILIAPYRFLCCKPNYQPKNYSSSNAIIIQFGPPCCIVLSINSTPGYVIYRYAYLPLSRCALKLYICPELSGNYLAIKKYEVNGKNWTVVILKMLGKTVIFAVCLSFAGKLKLLFNMKQILDITFEAMVYLWV